MEYLKGCKRCTELPKISYLSLYGDPYRTSYSITCCTTLTSKNRQEVIDKWNNFNIDCPCTFVYNKATNQWDKSE